VPQYTRRCCIHPDHTLCKFPRVTGKEGTEGAGSGACCLHWEGQKCPWDPWALDESDLPDRNHWDRVQKAVEKAMRA